jgi:hypothetical protein
MLSDASTIIKIDAPVGIRKGDIMVVLELEVTPGVPGMTTVVLALEE